jgi:CRP-like cAMP-binding protein
MGNILSITKFSTGKTIAGNILFSKDPAYPMTITALTDVTLLHLRKKEILDMCNNPRFVESLLSDFSERAAILSHTIKNITRKSLRQKLVDYLCYLYANSQTLELHLCMNKTELANRFGVARPSLSRAFTAMKKDGLISYDRNIIILHPSFFHLYID